MTTRLSFQNKEIIAGYLGYIHPMTRRTPSFEEKKYFEELAEGFQNKQMPILDMKIAVSLFLHDKGLDKSEEGSRTLFMHLVTALNDCAQGKIFSNL